MPFIRPGSISSAFQGFSYNQIGSYAARCEPSGCLNASATPAVAGETVAYWVDSAGTNQENLVVYSADISQSGVGKWNPARATALSATELKEDGSTNTHYLQQNPAAFPSATAGLTYRVAASVKRGVGSRDVAIRADVGAAFARVFVNLTNGTLSTAGTTIAWVTGPTVEADGDYYRVSGTFTPATTGVSNLNVYIATGATVSYAGDNTSTIHATKLQIGLASSSSTYVPTTTAAIIPNTATQGTDSLRPVMSRADNKENREPYSSALNTATMWATGSNATGTATASDLLLTEDGTAGVQHFIAQNAFFPTITSGAAYVYSVSYKPNGRTKFRVRTNTTNNSYVDFDTVAVTAFNVSGATGTIAADPDLLGYFRANVAFTGAATAANTVKYYLLDASGGSIYAGDNASGGYFSHPQLKASTADATYLPNPGATPLYAGVNGRSVPVFDGVDDYMDVSSLAATFTGEDKPISIVALAGNNVPVATTYDASIFGLGKSDSVTPYRWFAQSTGTSKRYLTTLHRDDAAATAFPQAEITALASGTSAMSWVHSGTAVNHFANGAAAGTAIADDKGATTLNRATIGAVGRNSAYNNWWNGPIAEIAIAARALSAGERNALEKYMGAIYGVTIS